MHGGGWAPERGVLVSLALTELRAVPRVEGRALSGLERKNMLVQRNIIPDVMTNVDGMHRGDNLVFATLKRGCCFQ